MKILPGSIAEKLSTVPKAAVVQPALLVGRQLRCNVLMEMRGGA